MQRRVSEAQSKYFLSSVEYTLAAKNVEFEKGTLLESISLFIVDDHAVAVAQENIVKANATRANAAQTQPEAAAPEPTVEAGTKVVEHPTELDDLEQIGPPVRMGATNSDRWY